MLNQKSYNFILVPARLLPFFIFFFKKLHWLRGLPLLVHAFPHKAEGTKGDTRQARV